MERAKILSRPEPTYTNEARQANASGTVLLKAMLTADGSVRYIEPIRSAQYGLTEQAIKAANSIRFKPESICGKPVNSWVQLEYLFSYGR
jgi:protein TonB